MQWMKSADYFSSEYVGWEKHCPWCTCGGAMKGSHELWPSWSKVQIYYNWRNESKQRVTANTCVCVKARNKEKQTDKQTNRVSESEVCHRFLEREWETEWTKPLTAPGIHRLIQQSVGCPGIVKATSWYNLSLQWSERRRVYSAVFSRLIY